MRRNRIFCSVLLAGVGIAFPLGASAIGAPITITLGTDFSTSPTSFGFDGSDLAISPTSGFTGSVFTFSADNSNFFPFSAVSTSGGGAVRTVFGSPSTDFPDRGSGILTYDSSLTYASFPTTTTIPYSNGDNYLGLRATIGGQDYFGYAFTTDNVLNSFGFETTPGTAFVINTSTAAVPEPASWAMMIGGFGLVGGAMRRRARVRASVSLA